jgi:hypothetical protein
LRKGLTGFQQGEKTMNSNIIVRAGSACPLLAKVAALLLALSLSLGCSTDDLGEDEAKITAASSGGTGGTIRFANNSRYEVHIRIPSSKETKKTLSAYSGSGAYPSFTYNAADGSSHNVYYSPASNVRASGSGSNQIIFYDR